MKKLIAFTLVLASVGFTASAQERRDAKKPRTEDRMKMGGQKYMKDLNLTEAQKAQLKAQREASKAQLDAIKNDATLPDAQKKEKAKAIFAEQKTKTQALLTAEQKAKLEESRKVSKERHKEMAEKRKDGFAKLNLSADQSAKIKAQREALKVKVTAIKNNSSLTEEQKKAQMKEVRQSSQAEMKSILTPEQQKQMQEMRKGHKGKGMKPGKFKKESAKPAVS